MRLSDLRDKPIRTLDGERLGRVHEVHCKDGKVVALKCGAASWIESITGKVKGRNIPWSMVRKVDARGILIAEPAAQAKAASAARTRRGTRPASARRSRR
jgi:sporulation protein YlmC with PRC-barrel domain